MKKIKKRIIYILGLILILIFSIYTIITIGGTIYLEDIDSGTTSPTGDYRWLDIANQSYSNNYKISYNYTQAEVMVIFDDVAETFHGVLFSENLKPNFAYQVKLVGYSGTNANERIGLVGRWWQEEWNGTAWMNGHNLNDKGDGSSPNPNDNLYYLRKNITDPTSPTGLKYKFTGYLVFDYFITDEYGNATLTFEVNSSYHVLWKTTQRTHTIDDGPIKNSTFDVNTSSPAYDIDYPEQMVEVFGEWERLPIGGVFLNPGCYDCQFVITEESFHGDGGVDAGNWAAAMGKNVSFGIADVISLQTNWNLISLPFNESINKTDIVVSYAGTNYSWNDAVTNNIILGFIYGLNNTNQNYETKDILDPGYGYWVWVFHNCDLLVSGNITDDGYITEFQQRWNIIGLPYNISATKQNLTINYNGTDYTWQQAVNSNIILGFIYGWNRNTQNYILSDSLDPGYGYWMYAYYDCILKK